ncbi:MAG: excinuclease ABC subunit UvrC [Alistipes sp.]|jgi:excinuclease ABC subunit C|nr:excinuclease ABC subunit UvrC [Alistipes sp.]
MATEKQSPLREQAAALPLVPGVYQFVDSDGVVLYVGKAKSLRKRVANYFAEARIPSKIRVMVRRAVEIRHIVTDTETDALLLENSLIKRLQPRYNAMLKDDKTYPWIVVQSEPFPRIRSTRQIKRDGSAYFGPYASIGAQKNLLEILHALFSFRTCSLSLTPEEIARGRYRPCLEYHIGNCKAPCAGLQSADEYDAAIDEARAMLRGELGPIRRTLTAAMKEAAAELRFEAAAGFKHRLDLLENYSARSVIASPSLGDLDVFALIVDDDVAYCNFARIVRGSIVNSFTVSISLGAEEDSRTILSTAISQIRERIQSDLAREVIVPFLPETELFKDLHFSVPKRGEKLKLLEFAEKNARMYRAETLKNLEIKDPEKATNRVMEAMQRELRLPREPRHIECFDNSNLAGTHPVASCVVFRDGKPARREYRHFNVKTVVGPDDFASMREIVGRRYSRLLSEGGRNTDGEIDYSIMPDLVVVDGGKGQLSAAYGVFVELGIADRVPLVGLAKRIEEVFFPGDPEPYYLSRNGQPLRVMMHIRDEAHRFGITFHRDKRSAGFIRSELSSIPGVGEKSVAALLKTFKTISAIRAASPDELAATVGSARANAISDFFHKNR